MSIYRRWFHRMVFLLSWLFTIIYIGMTFSYVRGHEANLPWEDQLRASGRVAIATAQGRLDVNTVFMLYNNSQRNVLPHIITAISTWLFDWNIPFENRVTFGVALITFGLLLYIIRQDFPAQWSYMIIPMAALLFNIRMGSVWLQGSLFGAWFYPTMFLALGIVLLRHIPARPHKFLLAVFVALCSTYSIAGGMVVWGTLLIWLLSQRDYRRPLYIALWSGVAVVSVGLYVQGINYDRVGMKSRSELNLVKTTEFVLRYLANAIIPAARHSNWGFVVAVAGLLTLGANSSILVFRPAKRTQLLLPITLAAQSVLIGLMLSQSRLTGISDRYISAATPFWIGNVILIVAVIGLPAINWANVRKITRGAIIVGNSMCLLIVVIVFGNLWYHNRHPPSRLTPKYAEDCAKRYLLTLDPGCFGGGWSESPIDELALNQLTMFSEKHLFELPSRYQQGDPIIVATQSDLQAAILVRWMLSDIPFQDQYILFQLRVPDNWQTTWLSLMEEVDASRFVSTQTALVIQDVRLRTQIERARRLWVVNATAGHFDNTNVLPSFDGESYVITDQTRFLSNLPFTLTRYELHTRFDEPLAHIGDDILLYEAELPQGYQAAACTSLAVDTIWQAVTGPGTDYSFDTVLADADGQGKANYNHDFVIPSSRWQAGSFYEEQRAVPVPCDVPPGSYSLLFKVYDDRNAGVALPVQSPISLPDDRYFYVTTVQVTLPR